MRILGITASAVTTPSFFTYLSNDREIRAIYINSDGIYATGYANASPFLFWVARFNFDGTINWQRTLKGTDGQSHYGLGIVGDSSGNIYALGRYVSGTSTIDNFIAKYNSSGTLQYNKKIDSGVTTSEYILAAAINSSNEIYALGTRNGAIQLMELTTTPTANWGSYYTQATLSVTQVGVTLDSSGNIYSTMTVQPVTINEAHTTKWDATGARLRNSVIAGGSLNWRGNAIASGSNSTYSNNIYMVGNGGSPNYTMLVKYDTDLNISWSRYLNTTAQPYAVTVSAAGDIYLATGETATNDRRIIIAKYDSSGTLQWQRRIDTNTGNNNQFIYTMSIDEARNKLALGGQINNNLFAAFLPLDGSGTGTYNVGSFTIVYDTPSLTSSDAGRTTAPNTTSTSTSSTLTITDANATEATPTYTVNNVQF